MAIGKTHKKSRKQRIAERYGAGSPAKKSYERHFIYGVVFGDDKYRAEGCFNTICKYKYLKEARKEALRYLNASIIKFDLGIYGDVLGYTIVE